MKNIFKPALLSTVAASLLLTTGCIEETFPTSAVVQDQISQSSKALESVAKGMPAYMKAFSIWSGDATDFGYPSVLIMLNVETQDVVQPYNGYQHFRNWQSVTVAMDDQYLKCQVNWYYFNFMARTCNTLIESIDPDTDNAMEQGFLAQGLAYRASTYLDMARIYEFLPNETISPINGKGNDVTGLTVPVTVPGMSAEELTNNPRLTHEEMSAFLLSDLQKAEDLFIKSGVKRSSKVMPDLGVVYGLMARVYMWDENYPKAAEYARKAITVSGATPLTKAQWQDPRTGFNDQNVPSWMFAIQQENNDGAVNDYSNWTSFMCSEDDLGYSGSVECSMMIDRALYESIDDADWRKLSFKAPEGSALSGQEPFLRAAKGAKLADYVGIKFRPGQGNVDDMTVAFATAIPLMRVEEMYFIEAEATAQTNVANGKQLLEAFMTTYRYPEYTCLSQTKDGVIDEIFKQKRIEFWGEGIIFYDYKRLDKGVTRAYKGTNWPETCRFNTIGRPGWMNWPIVDYEGQFNKAVTNYLNPNVGDKFESIDNID